MRNGALLALTLLLAGCQAPVDALEPQAQPPDVSGQPMLGDANAPVWLLAFEAPACSACRAFHLGTHDGSFQDLQANFIEPGAVAYVAYQWTIGSPYNLRAGVAAECAGRVHDALYFGVIERVFERQGQDDDALRALLHDVAPDDDTADDMLACFDARETLDDVQADIDYGRGTLGAFGSPAFFTWNGTHLAGPVGARDVRALVAQAVAA